MEPRHRKILQQNRAHLVKTLDPSGVFDGLLSRGIFSQDMIDEIKSCGARRTQARQLVKDLETRGRQAFPAFLECLHETGQSSLAEHLESGNPLPVPAPLPVQPTVIPLPVTNPENPDRADAPHKLVPLKPPSLSVDLLPSPCKYDKQGRLTASHNRFPGAVHGVDGPSVPVQIITNYLNGQNCSSLQGKPKVFFIQACGGDQRDIGFEVSPDEVQPLAGGIDDQPDAIPTSSSSDSLSLSDEIDARATLPTPSDILVSYSTFPGYVSWRDTLTGSWYVETLDRVLEENAATDDLVTMLMMVNNEVSQISAKGLYKQMPGSFNFLRKHLYFQAPAT
ncbi:caspase-9-like [Astyanax mexicanus]|uniref:Caspase-9-like n=1 Tax=Astyanax mexicanus TaxID=7994 RepID=A0A8T2LDX6_ASTMX|nr:caspase-9-like [Astyanax mexicanus]